MKKLLCALTVCLLVLSLLGAVAETRITVSGTGEVMVPADTAIVTLGVTAQKEDVLEAQGEVNTKIEQIRAALLASGIAKEDINTDRLRIYAITDYSQNVEKIVGYNAYSYLAIRTADMDDVGGIIDIAFNAGANTLDGIAFSASDNDSAKIESLKLSVADAQAKAQIIAGAAGLTITGIESVNESYTSVNDSGVNAFYRNVAADTAESASTVVQAAKISVTANISVVFVAE